MKTLEMTAGVRPELVRVLIVDDEPRFRELLHEEVAEMGFRSATARTAEDALRLLATESFGIALLDLQLPLLSGLDLFEQIRKQWPAMQVIVLTGHGDLESARRAIRLDVVDFLTKPCSLNDLEQALERARRRLPFETRLDPFAASRPDAIESLTTDLGTLARSEREQIFAVLKQANGNRTQAAAILGISRRTLHYRLNDYRRQGLEFG